MSKMCIYLTSLFFQLITITGCELQILDFKMLKMLMAIEQSGLVSFPHLLYTGHSFSSSFPKNHLLTPIVQLLAVELLLFVSTTMHGLS